MLEVRQLDTLHRRIVIPADFLLELDATDAAHLKLQTARSRWAVAATYRSPLPSMVPFHSPKMLTLEQIAELVAVGDAALGERLLPIEAALIDMPRIELDALQSARLQQGSVFLWRRR
ncbi:MAG: hypothetical protein ACT4NL_00090 [Pseudomarimonas sp.]